MEAALRVRGECSRKAKGKEPAFGERKVAIMITAPGSPSLRLESCPGSIHT